MSATNDNRDKVKSYSLAIGLTFGTFMIWGFAHRFYETLLPQFSAALSLSESQQSLASWALYFGYYLMALPAVLISRNLGYKSGVVFGLGTFSVGMLLFYPSIAQYAVFWLISAAAVIGSGLAILEVSADPLVIRLGPKQTAVRRLNLAQVFNSVGLIGGFFLGEHLLAKSTAQPVANPASTLVTPLLVIGIGVLLFAYLIDNTEFPPVAIDRVSKSDSTVKSFKPLLFNRRFMQGVSALFLYSVAQVVVWGFATRYALVEGGMALAEAKDVLLWSLVVFVIGRLGGTILMFRLNPTILLAVFAAGGMVCAAVAAFFGGPVGLQCVVGANFFLSIMFPTIFGYAIRDLESDTKTGAAILMFAAASGPAILALLKGIVGLVALRSVMAVPIPCFAAVAVFALGFHHADKAART